MERLQPIYDARSLGVVKMTTLGCQHLFAMFGGTVLVPMLTGLPVSLTLLFAGLGTLLFHLITKGKVPAFLGSSMTFVAVYMAVRNLGVSQGIAAEQALMYACLAIAVGSLLYFVVAGCIVLFGVERIMKIFPPVVTAPIIIAIGLTLAGSAVSDGKTDWFIAVVAVLTVIVSNVYGKGLVRIMPVLLGVIVSYVVAACCGKVDFTPVREAAWVGLPLTWNTTAMSLFTTDFNWTLFGQACIFALPMIFASIMEHLGDICAISSTTERNLLTDPGLHRTLMGDGAATLLASLFGAPANTTYSENTGTLSITKVYDPKVVRIAACLGIVLAFCPKFAALIQAMPVATMGGVSFVLYGMISLVGIRQLVDSNVDFSNIRNVVLVAMILMLAVGIKYGSADLIHLAGIPVSGLAVAAINGIVLNLIFTLTERKNRHKQ